MGRPLNKKYFGNKNSPYTDFQGSTTPDSGLGGSVASITIAGTNNNYTALPTVTAVGAPTLVGGVQAETGTVTMIAKSATVTTSGTGDVTKDYVVGDTLTVDGDVDAVFAVASTKVRTVGIGSQGTGTWADGDTFTFSTGFSTPAVISIQETGGVIDGFSIVDAGVRTATGALTDPVTPDSTSNAGGVQGVSFTLGMAVNAVTLTTGGSFTTIAANPVATTTNSANGTGATLTVSYGIASIAVDVAGSGYTSAPSITLSGGNATATAVLSVVNGARAIKAFAYLTGGSRLAADIIKQDNDRAYKVENATGVGVCQLVDSQANAAGEMDITAFDSANNEYWVKKLTARKAVLTRKVSGDGQFTSGSSVPWTLDAAVANYSVKIDNA